jgi:hypothetical protein
MLRFFVVSLALVLTAACSRTEVAYRNADQLLKYYSWQSVRSNSSQRQQLQPLLESKLQHHREQELPLVVAYLDLFDELSQQTDVSPDAACLVDGAVFLFQRHARLAIDLAVPLLLDLDSRQIEHLAGYMKKRHRSAVRRYLDPDPQHRKLNRQTRIVARIERWTGELNEEQRQQVHQALARIPDLSPAWLAQRAQQAEGLVSRLENGTNEAELRLYLQDWWVNRSGYSTATRQQWQMARREFIQLMAELGGTLTARQRRTLQNRVATLRQDLATFLDPAQQTAQPSLTPYCTAETA